MLIELTCIIHISLHKCTITLQDKGKCIFILMACLQQILNYCNRVSLAFLCTYSLLMKHVLIAICIWSISIMYQYCGYWLWQLTYLLMPLHYYIAGFAMQALNSCILQNLKIKKLIISILWLILLCEFLTRFFVLCLYMIMWPAQSKSAKTEINFTTPACRCTQWLSISSVSNVEC